MRYVLDASAALCWVLPRPNSGKALQLRADFQNAVHELIAPSVFSGEVASALTKAERQRLIPVGDARPLLGQVMRTLPVMHPYELKPTTALLNSQIRPSLDGGVLWA
jgi:predicted nucleic acid-binding protein